MRRKYYKKSERQTFREEMIAKHGDCCMICGQYVRHLMIDHDHETGYMRGVLCPAHNAGLGFFQDDPLLLRHAANYLERQEIIPKAPKPRRIRRQAEHDDALFTMLTDPTYISDRARARRLAELFPRITASAWQARISRTHRRSNHENEAENQDNALTL